MATYSWPAALYGKILKGSYQETPPDNVIRADMDVGPPKSRRRSTSNVRPLEVTHFFTTAEVAVFDEFYHNTLNSGALPFNYRHPRTQVMGEYMFNDLPAYAEMNQGYRITTKMELLP